jgi:peptidoglycan/xylan/chitin deacetylase (PgdA/CDA1 family)
MAPDKILYLMYHELERPGQSLCQDEPGYVRYVLSEKQFREQMGWLRSQQIRGVSVSDALAKKDRGQTRNNEIVITFDDGCASDLTVGLPLLRELGFGATFYITLGFLGRSGYLLHNQVRELVDGGFDVGCHSMTHAYLSDLDEPGLRREIVDAKKQLEEIIGQPVYHFSCPGGRWSRRAAEMARQAGYLSIATSRIGMNGPRSDPFQLARVAVMRNTPLDAYQNLCRGKGFWKSQLGDFVRMSSRRVLGNALYDRLRQRVLDRDAGRVIPME